MTRPVLTMNMPLRTSSLLPGPDADRAPCPKYTASVKLSKVRARDPVGDICDGRPLSEPCCSLPNTRSWEHSSWRYHEGGVEIRESETCRSHVEHGRSVQGIMLRKNEVSLSTEETAREIASKEGLPGA